jgi:hypothetical protein
MVIPEPQVVNKNFNPRLSYLQSNLLLGLGSENYLMKKILLISSVSIVLLSCGAVNRTAFGMTESKLIQTVSVEQGCPKEEIKILDKVKSTGNATYSLDVCGKRIVYKQIGSVLMEASKANNITNSMSK